MRNKVHVPANMIYSLQSRAPPSKTCSCACRSYLYSNQLTVYCQFYQFPCSGSALRSRGTGAKDIGAVTQISSNAWVGSLRIVSAGVRMRALGFRLLFVVILAIGCHPVQQSEHGSPDKPKPASPVTLTPLELVGTSWRAEDIGGRGVAEMVESTLTFETDSRIAGSTGCNRYFASIHISGASLRIDQTGSTRMACKPAAMEQETRFLAALQGAREFRFDPVTERLRLLGEIGSELVRFTKMKATEATSKDLQASPGRPTHASLASTLFMCGDELKVWCTTQVIRIP